MGPGVRVDSGYAAGDTVTPFYDNLLAKVVVWAPDRDRARGRMLRALRETEIRGVATTIPAHVVILEHPDFIAGRQSVNWVDTGLDLSALDTGPGQAPSEATAAPPVGSGAKAAARPAAWRSRRGVPPVSTWSPQGAAPDTSDQGAPVPAHHVHSAYHAPRAGHAPGRILAPMQGTVVQLLAGVGDQVLEDDGICVIEAMKMENVVRAGLAGAVTEISVSLGEAVDAGALIATIRE
jgi:acetyl-CoA/propionyl-CoA carboxylase biotin carboxyl carrier protein